MLHPVDALSARNDEAAFGLDFQITGEDTQLKSVLETTPVFFEIDEDGQTKTRFKATLVLQNANDLTGVNCDLKYDNTLLKVVEIHEARGDLNFDGRSNIADILVLGERFNQSTDENGFTYFDRDATGDSAGVIDSNDVEAVLPYINETSIFWTSNINHDLPTSSEEIRESVEIFESPDVSNANSVIDDIVVVLLSRTHPTPEGFGFDGDARIADIIFEVIGDISQGTQITFEDTMAIDEGTEITATEIVTDTFSRPSAPSITISRP